MVKIQDLAKACDCSIATVSKALNGRSDVSEKTAKRIREMAVQLHYLPLVAGQQLRTGHSYTIGVLLRRSNQGNGLDVFEWEILLHLKEALDQYGYALNLLPEPAGDGNLTIFERASRRNYDGVILFSPNLNDPQIQELFEKKLPMVALEAEIGDAICVSPDWQDSAYAVTKHLLSQGCEEIVLVCEADNRRTFSLTRGYLRALWEENIHAEERLFLQAPTEAELNKCLDHLHSGGILFADASLCRSAIAAYKKLEHKDIRFGYCGGETIPNVPGLVRYVHNTEKIAQEAARKLFLSIDLETQLPEQILVQGSLWTK